MTLVHHWSHPTTPAGPGWDIVISNAVELSTEKGFAARAGLGEADVIQVTVDDPAGAYDFRRGHRWYMAETSIAAGNQLVWNGYIGDQEISRGGAGGALFPIGNEHQWELHIIQENTLLTFRVIQGAATPAAGKRAAENADVRLTWLLGSAFLATVFDHGLIDWTGLAAFPMDAVDYRGQTGADVLRDIGLISGYNHYIRYREASGDIELACYDPNTSTLDSSTLQVSNVAADLDAGAVFATNSTYPPDETAGPVKLVRKGDRVAAGIYLPYAAGAVYGYDLTTSYKFGFIDQVAPAAKVKTLAKANALLARLLIQHNAQDERIKNLRIQLPAANLNDVKHGQRIQAKFSHQPGWDPYRWARVVSKSFSRPQNQAQDLYDVDLELSPQDQIASFLVAFQAIGANIGAPQPVDASTNLWTSKAWTGDFTTFSVIGCGAGPPTNEGGGAYARLIVAGESATVGSWKNGTGGSGGTHVYQVGGLNLATVMAGLVTGNTKAFVADGGTATITANAGATQSVLIGMILGGKVAYDGGWLAGSPSNWGGVNLVTKVLGTELINNDSYNGVPGQTGAIPWVWIGYVVGTGVLTLSAVLNSHGGGSGAYACGYNVGLVSLLIPTPGTFSIGNHGFGYNSVAGGSYDVVLPSAPTP